LRKVLLSLFSHRTLAVMRWDFHFMGVRLSNAVGGQRRRAARFVASRTRPVLLNLGAGPRGVADGHWVNVDGFRDAGVHFLVDLQRPLPFADATFDGVFSEHVLEHFTEEDGLRLVAEVARILRPGGVFRVVVPDGEFVMRSYFDEPDELVRYRGAGEPGETAMEMVNSFFRQRYEHQFMYDWLTLRRLLERVGFDAVTRSAFGASALEPKLTIDDPKYARESLYVEARKPGRDGDRGEPQADARALALEAAG
jgi:predicted SAM-dependent methyltransferase